MERTCRLHLDTGLTGLRKPISANIDIVSQSKIIFTLRKFETLSRYFKFLIMTCRIVLFSNHTAEDELPYSLCNVSIIALLLTQSEQMNKQLHENIFFFNSG